MTEATKNDGVFGSHAALVMAACLLILLISSAYAQTGTSTVSGTVSDKTGFVVPFAVVTLQSERKGFTRTQGTKEDGSYVFNTVAPGTYSMRVEAPGFKKLVVTGVHAKANESVDISIKLEIGSVIPNGTPVRKRVKNIKRPIVEVQLSLLWVCGAESYLVKDSAGGYFMFTLHTPDMPHPITADNPLLGTERALGSTEQRLLVKLLREWEDTDIPEEKRRMFEHYDSLKDAAAAETMLSGLSEADSSLLHVWYVIRDLEKMQR